MAGVILAAAAFAIWFAMGITFARQPGAVVPAMFWQGAAQTRANQARRIVLAAPDAAKVGRASILAVDALRRDPLNVIAAQTRGLVYSLQGNGPAADKMFGYAQNLSRRDYLTQVWYIEHRVAVGDVPGALIHYDRALRTSAVGRRDLIPILVSASADPNVAPRLEALVATRPPWWESYYWQFVANASDPESIVRQVGKLDLRRGADPDSRMIGAAIYRTLQLGDLSAAFALGHGVAGSVMNGGFEQDPVLPPIDWQLVQEQDHSAEREASANGYELRLHSSEAGGGEVARQLIALSAGNYSVSVHAGAESEQASAPSLALTCAGPGGEILQTPIVAARGGVHASFTVGRGCRFQWLTITLPSDALDLWMDDIQIKRVSTQ